MRFELKLASGKVVEWDGKDGEDASLRFVDCHRDESVVAWRNAAGYGISVLGRGTIHG